MKINKERLNERILLDDKQLDDIVGGAQSPSRPAWLR